MTGRPRKDRAVEQENDTPNDPRAEAARWVERLAGYDFPSHVVGGLALYLGVGIRPGSYLNAVLENNLVECVRRADPLSEKATFAIVRWLVTYAPAVAWGSPVYVTEWIEQHRQARQRVAS